MLPQLVSGTKHAEKKPWTKLVSGLVCLPLHFCHADLKKMDSTNETPYYLLKLPKVETIDQNQINNNL